MPAVAGSMTLAVRLPRAYKYGLQGLCFRERPYHAERTGTHSNAEVLKAVSGSVSTSEGDQLGTLSAAHHHSLFFSPPFSIHEGGHSGRRSDHWQSRRHVAISRTFGTCPTYVPLSCTLPAACLQQPKSNVMRPPGRCMQLLFVLYFRGRVLLLLLVLHSLPS